MKAPARPLIPPDKLVELVVAALEDAKAVNIRVLEVGRITSIADYMVIASGRSARQTRALAEHVVEAAKKRGVQPMGVEGMTGSEWILIDLGDVIVHAMQPVTREFYQLEKLWETPAAAGKATTP
jgi:ribosome-associated protein